MSKLAKFRPATVNANKHTQRGLRALEQSIREDGYVAPITVAADGEALDGSARMEVVADLLDVEPLIVEHDGTRPVVMVRKDIPNAQTDIAKRIAVRANRVGQIDLEWDAEVLVEMPSELLDELWTPDELSALGDAWLDVIGDDGPIDKGDRSGSSPWDRVEASDKVRCLIGDIEFGVSKGDYEMWASHIQASGIPREAAEAWFSQHLP